MKKEVIGDCTLYLADCRGVMAEMGDKSVDAVVTDPPYGVSLKAKVSKHSSYSASVQYDDDEADVLVIINDVFPILERLAARIVLTPGIRLLQEYPKATSIGTIFSPNGAGRDKWGFGCNTPILYYGKCPYLSKGMGSRPNSFYSAHPGMHVTKEDHIDHPCPKPIKWMLWLVNRASLEGETILDPFMGSGTTGVACVELGRKFIGVEIEPKYFDIACKRIDMAARQGKLF